MVVVVVMVVVGEMHGMAQYGRTLHDQRGRLPRAVSPLLRSLVVAASGDRHDVTDRRTTTATATTATTLSHSHYFSTSSTTNTTTTTNTTATTTPRGGRKVIVVEGGGGGGRGVVEAVDGDRAVGETDEAYGERLQEAE